MGMGSQPLYDFSPLLPLLVLGATLAGGAVVWAWFRNHALGRAQRHYALALLTLFLSFDLVLFGAFTRLTDSGLGCPDWPGCYGSTSPWGAHPQIAAAESAMPSGPVTQDKAWIEMLHRYLATGVGGLILVLAVLAWRLNRVRAWALGTLVWVMLQGAFGALTVTMKLFPAIVSLHLLGGYVLLGLLTVQTVVLWPIKPAAAPVALPQSLRLAMGLCLGWLLLQSASGAWVSTNYAVLVCQDFPQCQGSWWPRMEWHQGFELWHPLGLVAAGTSISFQALTAIHFTHRVLALVSVVLLGALVWRLAGVPALRRPVRWLGWGLVLQVLTGACNVLFAWPLAAAVLHTGGGGALVMLLVGLLAGTRTVVEPGQ